MSKKRKFDDSAYIIIPYKEYRLLKRLAMKALHDNDDREITPNEVVGLMILHNYAPIKAWRTYRNLTQAQVAESIGITQAEFDQIENNRKNPKETLKKVAAVFGIAPSLLKIDFQN